MTEQEKIKKIYKKKAEKLIKFNKAYFQRDNPIVSDFEFDQLKSQLLEMSKKYPFLKKIKNLDELVGSKPSSKFKKIAHAKPMLSLGNAFEKKRHDRFSKKNKKFFKCKVKS